MATTERAPAAGAENVWAIMGPSGSGKSTLMPCLAGLDTVTRGDVHISGTRVTGLRDKDLTRLRRQQIGFVGVDDRVEHRVIFLADGQVVDELADPTAKAVLDRMKRLDPHARTAPETRAAAGTGADR